MRVPDHKVFDTDALVADLTPVRRVTMWQGVAGTGIATVAVTVAVAALFGLRGDVAALHPDPMVVLRSGVLLLLGIATVAAVSASARPGIGQRHDGWGWALALAALFPAVSLWLVLRGDPMPTEAMSPVGARYCIGISLFSALAIGGVLTAWLRRGAVTNLARAGWLVGLGAGALGTFAYNLHCPSTSVHFIGIWYSLAVAASTVVGRVAVPRLIRW